MRKYLVTIKLSHHQTEPDVFTLYGNNKPEVENFVKRIWRTHAHINVVPCNADTSDSEVVAFVKEHERLHAAQLRKVDFRDAVGCLPGPGKTQSLLSACNPQDTLG